MARFSVISLLLASLVSSAAAFSTTSLPRTAVTSTIASSSTLYLFTKEKETTTSSSTDANQDKSAAAPAQDDSNNNDPKAKMAAMMQPIKDAGVAGAVSLFLWEAAFWIFSIPACSIAYYQTTGAWPDWSNAEDVAKVGAEAFAFANIARFALPLRVGLAISTTPWVQANLIDRFAKKEE